MTLLRSITGRTLAPYRLWRFNRDAVRRYRAMIGADLPREVRLERARRHAAQTPLSEKSW